MLLDALVSSRQSLVLRIQAFTWRFQQLSDTFSRVQDAPGAADLYLLRVAEGHSL